MSIPSLSAVIAEIGEVGLRMAQIDAAEGAAGNISVFVRDADVPDDPFMAHVSDQGTMALPVAVPALTGGWVIVTGGGRRLRDIGRTPETTLCLLQIHDDGAHATQLASSPMRVSSELNSHLAVHNDHVAQRDLSHHAIVHAQPPYLTYLSHLARYADTDAFNRRLLRWQPETIFEFPEGIGMLPLQPPGSPEQTAVTVEGLRRHRAVVWARHGILTRSDMGVAKAGDLVEYAETAAHYEYLNLQLGEPSSGLSDEELRLMCERRGINQRLF